MDKNQNEEKKEYTEKAIEKVNEIINTENEKDKFESGEMTINKKSAVLSYIPFISIYFIVSNKYKKSSYLHFHVNQGLNITITFLIIFFFSKILTSLFGSIDQFGRAFVPGIIEFICYIFYILLTLLIGFGLINTANGESKRLPLIGKYKLLK